ncbi:MULTISPECIES: ABC transporter permease [Oscillatoriales]|uniref:Uncharacterized protein n=2 Tax=Limnospira TaxID=2596745 RepID=A0A9P1P267_9CYAN|nr:MULTISPECIES: ABC transporter permease [Oscillatoriales]AMW30014.1 hypothetical protein AP285_20830 [Arthrospira platensis YZ]EKD08067.1 hypothetical protein SPLC1_S300880 [Arthrospira platensis C1]KDR53948.1 hypothetical protein APPUASWS_030680 [Arthrospira platensis str. Paraca]MBD2670866.1 ABC transporter permease [Arthrospira platensis FACHB-439]MBD2712068.1 ABC transporter permease [Arthrospira platensis FACHB-835]MDF2211925.1 ABC transporter permease [Arthrospira platensis NCB002]MD
MGYVLAIVFDPTTTGQPLLVRALILAMITLVAIVSRNRISRQLPQLLLWVWVSLFISTAAIDWGSREILLPPPPLQNRT